MKREIARPPPPPIQVPVYPVVIPGTMDQFQQQPQPFQQNYPSQPFANTQQPPSGTQIYPQF